MAAKVNRKVYKGVVRPAVLYGLKTVALTKEQETELKVAEIKMSQLERDKGGYDLE